MPTESIIAVEGVQDLAVVARLLEPEFSRARDRDHVPPQWRRFIPTRPPQPDLRPIRVLIPVFLHANDGRAVMIRATGSDDQIPTKLAADLKDLSGGWPRSIGALIDADGSAPQERLESLNRRLSETGTDLRFPSPAGTIATSGTSRCGAYVLPDNQSQGGLELLLLEGGKQNFPTLLSKSTDFVQGIEEADVPRDKEENDRRWRELNKWGRSKAIIHAAGAILRPTRPTQATLEDDAWFEGSGMPLIEGLRRFLRDLVA